MADIAFLWHMHQPDYRDPVTGHFTAPWVLLHALKDYTDMAGHLERHPGLRCTVNFVPVLLDQVEDYCEQLDSGQWRDRLLHSLGWTDPDTLPEADRAWLLDAAFRCNATNMLEPFAPYRQLRDLLDFVRTQDRDNANYLSGQYFSDLTTWYVLAWTGETLRREHGIIEKLMAKGSNFDLADRQALLAELARVMKGLIPRYRALADRGQIELSCSPSHHPLAPLLLDFNVAREAMPDCALPDASGFPGGRSRVEAHIRQAQDSHLRRFGQPPNGLWPAEGALSTAFLRQIAEAGFQWTASSQSVLTHSAGAEASTGVGWQAPEGTPNDITLFFRNDRLSDLIGFEYSKWHGRDATGHFMSEVTALHVQNEGNLIPIFLDGENAWEYYPYNAWHFFDDLYEALEKDSKIRTVTLSEACTTHRGQRGRLPRLVAGSWVYGTLSTWIGSPEKNRAWELLCEVKLHVDWVLGQDEERLTAALRADILHRLAVCESSDWFWWLGDYNPSDSVLYFDHLFRENIKALYRLLDLPIPASLEQPLSSGGGVPESGGTMRRAT